MPEYDIMLIDGMPVMITKRMLTFIDHEKVDEPI